MPTDENAQMVCNTRPDFAIKGTNGLYLQISYHIGSPSKKFVPASY